MNIPCAKSFPCVSVTVTSDKQILRPTFSRFPSTISLPSLTVDRLSTLRSREISPASSSKVSDQIETIIKAMNDITAKHNQYTNKLGNFKVFCEINALNWQTAVKSDIMLTYSEM